MNAAESTWWQRLRTTRLRDVVRGRIDGRLDWRRVIAEAGLPAAVAAVIEQVVGRSRLWRSEKVDVAQELVAHFQDGIESGRTPQQLVESFGDPASAARLIRRAKKRGRTIVWQMWRWACWSVAALVLVYAATAIYLIMGRPSITTDYLAIANVRALSVPEEERAWPLYRQALAQMNNLNPVPKWSSNDLGPGGENWPEAEAWLAEHQAALALVRQAAKRPEMGLPAYGSFEAYPLEDRRVFYPPSHEILKQPETKEVALEDRWLISTLLPHIQWLREMARLLAIDARRAASAGDGEAASADLVALMKMSHHCEEQPFLVNALVSAALQKLAFVTIQDVLTEYPALWSDDQLRDLAHSIAAAQIDWRRPLEGERYSFYDVVQRLYTDDGEGDGRITDDGLRAYRRFEVQGDIDDAADSREARMEFGSLALDAIAPASLYVIASRRELVEKYNSLMDRLEGELDRPLWGPHEADPVSEVNDWSALKKSRYSPIPYLMPAISSVRLSIERHRGERDGILVGIALELYHREHGAWPKTLAELTPEYLPEVPVDRISGDPLGYQIVDDRPLVYSTGVDGDDDSGRLPKNDEGPSDLDIAGPNRLDLEKVDRPDGDWVIWSTAKSEN